MPNTDPLLNISPLDGRYHDKVESLSEYFSEYALIKARVLVEVEWFILLCDTFKLPNTRKLQKSEVELLRKLYSKFELEDAKRVKQLERETNHDVKAVEYFIKEKAQKTKLKELFEFIHFGCTSEDITNVAYSILLKRFREDILIKQIEKILKDIYDKAKRYKSLPMMAHTHGQPATPTTVGKEFVVFAARLKEQLERLKAVEIRAKMNGASGNYNAHIVAYPNFDWIKNVEKALAHGKIKPNLFTTQIESHDYMVDMFDITRHINNILINLCRDMWMYISYDYFKQKQVAGEVGSSTMPHKVNPIDFENAEGNLGIANGLLFTLSEKLPISRMQRDLTDSTTERNIGSAFGYSILAYKNLLKGLGKIDPNRTRLSKNLDNHWELLAEPIQTVMRKYKIQKAYEKLKDLTRGKNITRETIHAFIKKLEIPDADKKRLLKLTPETYTGLAEKIINLFKL